ncbi:MAG TPA: DUF2231 domain-containing protein [Thermomicrobiales bacterium]|nr:DUF2231 domain-containing protein [Thermomicrobiales bacterium]
MLARRDGRFQALGHPLHPILTDFPIALWSLAFLWDVLALWRGGFWWEVSFWTLSLGLAAASGAALTGLLDARRIGPDDSAGRTVNRHMLLMGTATMIFVGNLLVRGGTGELSGMQAAAAVACTLIGNAAVIAGAWFGGELVFSHGVGVAEQPVRIAPRPEPDTIFERDLPGRERA